MAMNESRNEGRGDNRPEGRGPGGRGGRRGGKRRPKVCFFCVDKIDHVDYKDVEKLRKYVSERGKIMPRRITGNCAKHQRELTTAIKRSRSIALMPFAVTEG